MRYKGKKKNVVLYAEIVVETKNALESLPFIKQQQKQQQCLYRFVNWENETLTDSV